MLPAQPSMSALDLWTSQELWYAIGQLKEQPGSGACFCFFIDGLDEFDGHPQQIVEVLEAFKAWPDIKLCVSSRPLLEFIDAFGRSSDPQLALQSLTAGDISLYVKDTLEANELFRKLKDQDNISLDLPQEIVDKAQGVFLWVVLVTRSLLDGLRNADRMSHLRDRLRDFPATLEDYFHHMFASIDSVYREETARLFKIALAARWPLPLTTYSFLDDDDDDDDGYDGRSTNLFKPIRMDDLHERKEKMKRRLVARCKGLLEIDGAIESEDLYTAAQWCTPRVQFLHRTVLDFLQTKDVNLMISESLDSEFNPIMQCNLCTAKSARLP